MRRSVTKVLKKESNGPKRSTPTPIISTFERECVSSAAVGLQQNEIVSRTFTAPDAGPKRKAILCLLLCLVTLAFYGPIVHDGFVLLDDVPYILGNPAVRAGITWQTVKWSFTSVHAGYWHPLTWLSHALDCQFFGLNPAGHHYVSLLFHAANALLLFLLLEEATSLFWPSFMVAALFALHPVNVESIAWAAERKNVLSMFFFLLALWAYGRYGRRGGTGRYLLVAGLFALGLMSKPQIITLPCALLLWDYWPLKRMFAKPVSGDESNPAPRSFGFLVAEKIPLFILALAGSIMTVKAQRTADAVRALSDFSLSVRLQNAIVSYTRYLKLLFWPEHLTPLYPHPGSSLTTWQTVGSVLLLLAITAMVLWFKEKRYLAMGWFWFLGVLVPMIGIVQVGEQAMADRFVYIPIIGIAIAFVWGGYEIAEEKEIPAKWLVAPTTAVLLILGALTYHQVGYWKDGITLFRYTLSITDKNYMAHQALAMALDKENRMEEAIPEFNAAEALHDFPLPQVLNLGIYEERNGHVDDAMRLYQKVLSKSPDPQLRGTALDQIGSAEIKLKNYENAQQAYESALQIRPDDPAALLGSGLLAERDGKNDVAVTQLAKSADREPSDIAILLLVGALRRDHRLQEAQAAEEMAAKISRDLSRARAGASQMEILFGVSPETASSTAQSGKKIN
jgi:tetratricopeptide (TPR) repeat protein